MEGEKRTLLELRVVDLKKELEVRGLEKCGVKAVLIERLKEAMQRENLDPDTHLFELADGKNAQKCDESFNSERSDEKLADDKSADIDNGPNGTGEDVAAESHDEEPAKDVSKEEEDIETQADDETGAHENEVVLNVHATDDLLGTEEEEEQQQEGDIHVESDVLSVPGEQETAEMMREVDGDHKDDKEDHDDSCDGNDEKMEVVDSAVGDPDEAGEAGEDCQKSEDTSKEPQDGQGAAGEAGNENESGAAEKKDPVKSKIGANLWVRNLSPQTKATDLKRLFSRHGKLVGAKIVTSARTPGARCYGYVTMANADDAERCIEFLHRVECHGRVIAVERAKDDATGPLQPPRKREPPPPRTSRPGSRHKEGARDHKSKSRSQVRVSPRSRGHPRRSPPRRVLSLALIKQERERERRREAERRAKIRRDQEEELRVREKERRQRLEAERLEKEKLRLRLEREKLEREKEQLLRLERENQRLERERLEREKEEIRNRKRKLQERVAAPPSRSAKRLADDKRTEFSSKRTAVADKDDLMLEPPPPPRFNEADRTRDRSRRDEKRSVISRREDYRHSSPSRDRYSSRDKNERDRKDDGRKHSSSTHTSQTGKPWASNGASSGYSKPYSSSGTSSNYSHSHGSYGSSRQEWSQSISSSRWPAESESVAPRSAYPSAVYGGSAAYSASGPTSSTLSGSHARYGGYDSYAHSLPVRKY